MTALNADISTVSMKLLKIAKVVRNQPLKEIVQEAIDQWLKQHGITEDALNKLKSRQ